MLNETWIIGIVTGYWLATLRASLGIAWIVGFPGKLKTLTSLRYPLKYVFDSRNHRDAIFLTNHGFRKWDFVAGVKNLRFLQTTRWRNGSNSTNQIPRFARKCLSEQNSVCPRLCVTMTSFHQPIKSSLSSDFVCVNKKFSVRTVTSLKNPS